MLGYRSSSGPDQSSKRSLLLSGVTLDLTVLLVHAGNEVAEAEVLDHGLEDGVFVDLDVLDLDLGSVGDLVHSALSFLL